MHIDKITNEDIERFARTDVDQFRRDYPLRIVLKNNDVIFGHIVVVSYAENDFTISLFKQVENMEDWKSNKIRIGSKNISPLLKEDIEDISVFRDY